jgi:hypothetical protein
MKKTLDSGIFWELNALAIEKNIDFKKWFQDEQMMLEGIPVSIYELMTAFPMEQETSSTIWKLLIEAYNGKWVATYFNSFGDMNGRQEEPELVDALGKLLIWVIKEGWLG